MDQADFRPLIGEDAPAGCVLCRAPVPWPHGVMLKVRPELADDISRTLRPGLAAALAEPGNRIEIDHRICIRCYKSFADWLVALTDEALDP